eukprot:TRINITY_DN2585_c0_g1_i1.p1 TRINITY_DN2585_c0_g1~~TRINITY_DN2585_c0_g1_i1.p1  ORF type:complete len:294 (-),score=61.66 TRINITY_DN2585_c0_g1_i1:24-842(-)
MNLDAYLNRIGYDGPRLPTFDVLKALIRAHQASVPFENLDIHTDIPIKIDPEAFYQKIVTKHRGGYCYEQNVLFHWVLKQFGFDCEMLGAQIFIPDMGFNPLPTHSLHRVTFDGVPYHVDVGYGASPAEPLPLDSRDEHKLVDGSEWRLLYGDDGEGFYSLQSKEKGEFVTRYGFRNLPIGSSFQEYLAGNEWVQNNPHSPFVQSLIATLPTSDGRKTISGNRFILTKNGQKTIKEIESNDELNRLLKEEFGLEYEGVINIENQKGKAFPMT